MMMVSVKLLSKLNNPLDNPPWVSTKDEGCIPPISHQEIEAAIKNAKHPVDDYDGYYGESRAEHINRIAWYVINGWGESSIELLMSSNGCTIVDGNHRVCSAIYRGDEMIQANVFGHKKHITLLYADDD